MRVGEFTFPRWHIQDHSFYQEAASAGKPATAVGLPDAHGAAPTTTRAWAGLLGAPTTASATEVSTHSTTTTAAASTQARQKPVDQVTAAVEVKSEVGGALGVTATTAPSTQPRQNPAMTGTAAGAAELEAARTLRTTPAPVVGTRSQQALPWTPTAEARTSAPPPGTSAAGARTSTALPRPSTTTEVKTNAPLPRTSAAGAKTSTVLPRPSTTTEAKTSAPLPGTTIADVRTRAARSPSESGAPAAAAAAANCADRPRGRWVPQDGQEYVRRTGEQESAYPDVCWISKPTRERYLCKPRQLGLRWETDCLDGVDPARFLRAYANKTVSFVGDSMVRQLFFRFACFFGGYTVATDLTNPNRHDNPLHRVVLRGNVTLLNQWFGLRPNKYLSSAILQGDVYVVSAGAFAKTWDVLEVTLRHWHQALSGPGRRLVYLEYAAPHFPSPSSDFENTTIALNLSLLSAGKKACTPLDYAAFVSSASGFRLLRANALVEALNMTVLRVFNVTAAAFEQHNMEVWGVQMDCRHYCDPSPAMDAQVQVLYNLLTKNETPRPSAPR